MSSGGWVELVLLRHGRTHLNEEHRYQGVSDPGLSEAGRREARSIADGLGRGLAEEATLWCSSLRRSRETVRWAFPDRQPRVDDRLDELDFGDLEGRTHREATDELGERYEGWIRRPGGGAPPGGESLGALEGRVTGWLRDLERGRTHVAVTHLGPIQALIARVLEIPLQRARRVRVETGGWTRLLVPAGHEALRSRGSAEVAQCTGGGANPDAAAATGEGPAGAVHSSAADVRELARQVEPPAGPSEDAVRARLDALAKPPGSLGRLEDLAVRLARIGGDPPPSLRCRRLFVFLGDHGVARHGVSAYPRSVTAAMSDVFARGEAVSQALARACDVEVVPVDVGVDSAERGRPGVLDRRIRRGTRDLRRDDALTADEVVRSVRAGGAVVAERTGSAAGRSILAVGEMGIGNTTAASAVAVALTGRPTQELVGPGSGVGGEALERKRRVVEEAMERLRGEGAERDPIRVLAAVGGFEIAAMVGSILEGARRGLPVVLDGFISTAAGLAAVRLAPAASGYLFASHRSVEPGHRVLLDELQLRPILELELRLGEGTGAVLAAPILDAAGAVLRETAVLEDVLASPGTVSGGNE